MKTSTHLDLYNISQLATHFATTPKTAKKILDGIPAEGEVGIYPAWSVEAFAKARVSYQAKQRLSAQRQHYTSTQVSEQTSALQEADLRAKLARCEQLEINNLKEKKLLVSKKAAVDYINYFAGLNTRELKSLAATDELYNMSVESIARESEAYVAEHKDQLDSIQYVLTPTTI